MKDAFRRRALLAVRALPPAERARRSATIRERVRAAGLLQPGATILFFAALPSEPDLLPLLDMAGGVRYVFPRARAGGRLTLHHVTDPAHLRAAGSRVREPDCALCPEVAPDEITLALVPGLAFDPSSLVRLGRGGGYYDRLLGGAGFRARRIGVAFASQLFEGIPAEPHDQLVDAIITDA